MVDSTDIAALIAVTHTVQYLCDHGAWEQQQTHVSLIPYAIEEVYELQAAIYAQNHSKHDGSKSGYKNGYEREPRNKHDNNFGAIIAELGDVLLQVLLHAAIAEREGNFTLADIAYTLDQKLRERSAPVFSGQKLTVQEQDAHWQAVKTARESEHNTDDFFAFFNCHGSPWHRAQKFFAYLAAHDFPLTELPQEIQHIDIATYDEEQFCQTLTQVYEAIAHKVYQLGTIPHHRQQWRDLMKDL